MRGQGCDGLVDMKLIFLLKRLLLPSGINDNDELMTMVVWCQMDIIFCMVRAAVSRHAH